MIGIVSTMCGVFLGPLAVEYIITSHQIKELEKEEKRLRKMERLGISDDNLRMPARNSKGESLEITEL